MRLPSPFGRRRRDGPARGAPSFAGTLRAIGQLADENPAAVRFPREEQQQSDVVKLQAPAAVRLAEAPRTRDLHRPHLIGAELDGSAHAE
jgi:hypothetical protein